MNIIIDDLSSIEIRSLITHHLSEMKAGSPPDSVHALDLNALQDSSVTVWSVWEGNQIAGCGALKELSPTWGELKSMRTAPSFLRKGIASLLLDHMIDTARERGYTRLSLETGSDSSFIPAHKLYQRKGFHFCRPFGEYKEDPHSYYMTKEL
ncbi:GNAT family N-acetyltransferase [Spirochaeta cellobiosiphila]|uniref:GNAT family N-acetyltransferase n=1 Tax=Spirochaeta cellobiosiphila TaxID=504483 RepID=UPI00040F95E0|nr:GNAT family N-acetyltransferase [Spirochaeta cellobiosiphila]